MQIVEQQLQEPELAMGGDASRQVHAHQMQEVLRSSQFKKVSEKIRNPNHNSNSEDRKPRQQPAKKSGRSL